MQTYLEKMEKLFQGEKFLKKHTGYKDSQKFTDKIILVTLYLFPSRLSSPSGRKGV